MIVTAYPELELARREVAAMWRFLELARDGVEVDVALELVDFPTWPGEVWPGERAR